MNRSLELACIYLLPLHLRPCKVMTIYCIMKFVIPCYRIRKTLYPCSAFEGHDRKCVSLSHQNLILESAFEIVTSTPERPMLAFVPHQHRCQKNALYSRWALPGNLWQVFASPEGRAGPTDRLRSRPVFYLRIFYSLIEAEVRFADRGGCAIRKAFGVL